MNYFKKYFYNTKIFLTCKLFGLWKIYVLHTQKFLANIMPIYSLYIFFFRIVVVTTNDVTENLKAIEIFE